MVESAPGKIQRMIETSKEVCAGCKVVGDCYAGDNTDKKCPCVGCLIKSVCLEICDDAFIRRWALQVAAWHEHSRERSKK